MSKILKVLIELPEGYSEETVLNKLDGLLRNNSSDKSSRLINLGPVESPNLTTAYLKEIKKPAEIEIPIIRRIFK